MALPDDVHWPDYYRAIAGRGPRPLLQAALSLFPEAAGGRLAIDLGCGDGTETLFLLDRGWRVLAVDGEPEAIALLCERVPAADRGRLAARLASFADLALPPADLIFAGFSLPFCPPEAFATLWPRLVAALRPAGVLAVHLFGDRDGWAGHAGMTFQRAEALPALLAGLTVVHQREIEHDGPSGAGPKHWHTFEIIAQRPAGVVG